MKFRIKYFNNVKDETESRNFCNKCKPYFSNKFNNGDSKIINKSAKVASFLNSYYTYSSGNGVLRSSEFSFNYWTEFINKVPGTCTFSNSLKLSDIVPAHSTKHVLSKIA